MANRYQSQARYFDNLLLIDRYLKAAVHLEGGDDILFWDALLHRIDPMANFKFITYSKSQNNKNTSGCEQCLKYKPYLTKRFFICIDSDTRYLLSEKDIDATHYIGQTYTYSWENHICQASELQFRFSNKGGLGFDFSFFLLNLSHEIFKPWILLLHNLKIDDRTFGFPEFNHCIPTQCSKEEIADNGQGLIQKIHDAFSPYIISAKNKGIDFTEEGKLYQEKGLNMDTAYLYVRGHNIYDLVHYIGKIVFKDYPKTFRVDVLDIVPRSVYPEIVKVEEDLRSILT